MTKPFFKYAGLTAMTLFLAACGEGSGWEMQFTTKHFPYGNERTAGSGVIYVRAKMLPEKELKLKSETGDAEMESLMKAVDRTIEPMVMHEEALKAVQESLRKGLSK